jgi:hypothetical protein
MMAKELVRMVAMGNTVIGAAYLAGAKTTLDPDDPDWGKIRFGDTRIDIWGGFQQPARVIARTGSAVAKRVGWKDMDRGEQIEPWTDMFWRMISYKFAPNLTISNELLTGKTPVGEKVGPTEVAIRSVAPLFAQDVYDAWKEEGIGSAAATGVLSYVGIGTQTYPDSEKKVRAEMRELYDKATPADSSAAKALKADFNRENPTDSISSVSDTRHLVMSDIKELKKTDRAAAEKMRLEWNRKNPLRTIAP